MNAFSFSYQRGGRTSLVIDVWRKILFNVTGAVDWFDCFYGKRNKIFASYDNNNSWLIGRQSYPWVMK